MTESFYQAGPFSVEYDFHSQEWLILFGQEYLVDGNSVVALAEWLREKGASLGLTTPSPNIALGGQ